VKKVYLSILCAAAGFAHADSGHVSPGSTLTTGPVSNGHALYSATHNPAVAALTVGKDENWRIAYLPSISFSTEVGDVNDFVDELDELIDILDDSSLATDSIEETLDRFNRVLKEMGENGYAKVGVGITAPIFPIYWRPSEFSGTFFMEAGVDAQVRLGLLDQPLVYDDQHESFSTGSSAYLKSGIEKRISLGYAKPMLDERKSAEYGGQLYAGAKLKLMNLELSKQVMRLQLLEGRDIEDVMEDEYDNNLKSTTNIGIDVGVSWVTRFYSAGFTLKNINSPSFKYGTVGVNCAQYEEGSFGRNNCEAAAYFAFEAGEINAYEKHKKHATATVDGSFYPTSFWSLSASADLASYDDIVGMETQMFNLSTAINTKSLWIPDIRLGYHKNLAGSKLASAAVGLSFFDTVTLDARIALDEVTIDGDKAPRSVAFSIAFEEKF